MTTFMQDSATVQGTLYRLPVSAPRGDAILPLKQLRTRYPDLYERHARKYAGRPNGGLDQPVPPLGCTWTDVVFLSPVHPAPLFDATRRAGLSFSRRMLEPWTLDAARLDPARTVIRLMRHGSGGHYTDPPDEHDYLPFTTAGLRAVSRVTVTAIQRLESLTPGDPVLYFVDVPHVLYHGAIPVSWFQRPGQDPTGGADSS
jgi:hypothetical protein